jgi:ribulose-5-phosphate 4-epimerase/fuculose-1-phosphate aldolase
MQDTLAELRSKVALSCRILAMMGLVKEITGHVSARIPDSDQMFIRCRGVDEYGLPFTSTEAVQQVGFDGDGPDASRFGRMREVNYEVPAEYPIHGEILRARPQVNCVIHATHRGFFFVELLMWSYAPFLEPSIRMPCSWRSKGYPSSPRHV